LLGQTPLEALERELKDLGKQHEAGERSRRDEFSRALQAAVVSPAAALRWWEECGGRGMDIPRLDLTKEDSLRRALEAGEARGVAMPEVSGALAGDPQARKRVLRNSEQIEGIFRDYAQGNVATAVWRHCQLLQFAAEFSAQKTDPAKNPRWLAWLQDNVAGFQDIYSLPVMDVTLAASPLTRHYDQGESLLDKEMKGWSLYALPAFYSSFVLEPRRTARSPETGRAWEGYITLLSAEVRNREKWTSGKLPWLLFQKQADECRITPGTMPLTRLVEILKEHPEHPQFREMQKIAEELLADLKKRKG
jgi:hypothetical protein